MTAGRPLGEDDLQAYVDGRLDAEHRAAVEAYLASDDQAARRITEEIADRDELRSRLSSIAEEPIPARLRIAHLRAGRSAARQRRSGMLAAALACLMAGGAGGWFASGSLRPAAPLAVATPVADDAIHAWRTYAEEIVHPVEVAADHESHLVQWLSRRLGRRLLAPKLDALGLKLIGGRLLPAAGAPAAQFMYEDAQGKRLAAYVRPGGGDEPTAFRFERKGDVSAFFWIDAELSYAVVARTDRDHLLRVSRAVFEQYGDIAEPASDRAPRN